MYPTRLFHLVLLAVGFVTVAQATWLDSPRIPRRDLLRRQSGSVSGDGTAAATTTPPTPEETSSTIPPPEETPTSSTVQTTPPPPVTTSPTRPGPTTSVPRTTSTTASEEDETTSTTSTTSQTPVVQTRTTVIIATRSDGQLTSITTEATTTTTPGLSDESNSGTSGMPTNTRNIIIGVVVGVGGFIVLGALGFVAFRIWGRKKSVDENDGLMDYPPTYSSAGEPKPMSDVASSAGTNRTPFQSTLESYHAPNNNQVNASSNF